jgi:hypothetical protein
MNIDKLTMQFKKINDLQNELPELCESPDTTMDEFQRFCNENSKKNPLEGTYLESKESIIELYKLFIFYGLLDSFFPEYNRAS